MYYCCCTCAVFISITCESPSYRKLCIPLCSAFHVKIRQARRSKPTKRITGAETKQATKKASKRGVLMTLIPLKVPVQHLLNSYLYVEHSAAMIFASISCIKRKTIALFSLPSNLRKYPVHPNALLYGTLTMSSEL